MERRHPSAIVQADFSRRNTMTYDPDRDARAPGEMNPNVRPHEREANRTGLYVMLGLAALVLVGAFIFMNRPATVATDARPDARPPITTGAGPGAVREVYPGAQPSAP